MTTLLCHFNTFLELFCCLRFFLYFCLQIIIFLIMSKLFWLCAIVLLVAVVFFVARAFTVPNGDFMTVSNEEFARIVADTDSVVLLDVRTKNEFDEAHLRGAILIDVKTDSFKTAAIERLPKDKVIAVYCRSGRRSVTAANILTEEGYKVVNLKDGITGWKDDNREVVSL